MPIPLGVPDIQRLEEGLERGCGETCFRFQSFEDVFARDVTCEDWICNQIRDERAKEKKQYWIKRKEKGEKWAPNICPCDHMDHDVIIERVLLMLETGKTID